MAMHDFDFQLGRNIRLRGCGILGFAALALLISGSVILALNSGAPLALAIKGGVLHLISALKNILDSMPSETVNIL